MSWASKRKAIYSGTAFVVVLVLAIGSYVLFFYHTPTCTDGAQNGMETGIDCGGGCQKVCPNDAIPAVVLWSRSFEVAHGVWNAVAYVENQNTTAGVHTLRYRFRLFDAQNILLIERSGTTFLAPHTKEAIVEPSVLVGERTPARTEFSFLEVPPWETINDSLIPNIVVRGSALENADTKPRISATLINRSVQSATNVEASAVAFDEEGNALSVSRTIILRLAHNEEKEVVFTWPNPFSSPVSRIEVLARAPFFSAP